MEKKSNTVLIVDDEPQICATVGRILEKKGFAVSQAHDGVEALEKLDETFVDVVLLDVKMPRMGGLEALANIRKKFPDVEVIMVTAFADLDTAVESLKTGAYGFLTKPINAEHLAMEINKALEHRKMIHQIKIYEKRLEMQVDDKTQEARHLYELLESSFANAIRLFVDLLSMADPSLAGHCKRVAILAVRTGEKVGLNKKRLKDLEEAALLHDFGKLGLPERLRHLSLDELAPKEQVLMKKQMASFEKALETVDQLRRAGNIIRNQMERMDGKGVPNGLKGEEIPLESRILAVASAFDDIACDPKEGENGEEAALRYLKRKTGGRYDRRIVERFREALLEVKFDQKSEWAVPLADLKEEMILSRDLVDDAGKLVLSKGTRLSAIQLVKIKSHGLFTHSISQKIYIRKPGAEI